MAMVQSRTRPRRTVYRCQSASQASSAACPSAGCSSGTCARKRRSRRVKERPACHTTLGPCSEQVENTLAERKPYWRWRWYYGPTTLAGHSPATTYSAESHVSEPSQLGRVPDSSLKRRDLRPQVWRKACEERLACHTTLQPCSARVEDYLVARQHNGPGGGAAGRHADRPPTIPQLTGKRVQ